MLIASPEKKRFLKLAAVLPFVHHTTSLKARRCLEDSPKRAKAWGLHTASGHRRYGYSAALLYFYAPHHNPEPTNLNPEPFMSYFMQHE